VPASHALVLNASYEPLCVVTMRRAVVLVLAEKALVVEHGEGSVRSERLTLAAPSVVRLTRYVRVPYRRTAPLTRRAVLERDGHSCAYCARRAESVDHVVPKSRGGRHEWANVVAACLRCNRTKGDRMLGELGWTLHFAPAPPPPTTALLLVAGRRDPAWSRYLAPQAVSA
jgi:5-methylcytosine-specific restriction endonuclease McrA